jgi:PR domain zinc finger protein 10
VPSRAWASLPATYLTIGKLNKAPGSGIFARKVIPKKTQFGPLEGVLVKEHPADLNQSLELSVELDDGSFIYIDTTNESEIEFL